MTPPIGNSRGRALNKLLAEAPDLHADVLAGRISAHAAMVQAGFRPKVVSVPVGRPESVASTLRRYMDPEDVAKLRDLLA